MELKEIKQDFIGKVIKVVDGDTIRVDAEFLKNFPVRMVNINAPEMNETEGENSKQYLKSLIDDEEVEIRVNEKNNVGKWGRLLGHIFHLGISINDTMLRLGYAKKFENKNEGKIIDTIKMPEELKKWH